MTLSRRVPKVLTQLKTYPGGQRNLGRFDPRIKELWSLLVHALDAPERYAPPAGLQRTDRFTLEVNVSRVALTLKVNRKTVRRWLAFFERRGWLKLTRRGGGRGRGITARLTWLERGKWLAKKRQGNGPKPETGAQGLKASLRDDSANRARHMARARQVLHTKISNPVTAAVATTAFGRWLWKERPTLDCVNEVLKALDHVDQIHVPRWAQVAQAVHRWFRGLIAHLACHGAVWWVKLKASLRRRKLRRTLARIEAAIEAGRPCPVCGKCHTRWEWREGIGCAGWARERLAGLSDAAQPAAQPAPRREIDPAEVWVRWREERERERAWRARQAEAARALLRRNPEVPKVRVPAQPSLFDG